MKPLYYVCLSLLSVGLTVTPVNTGFVHAKSDPATENDTYKNLELFSEVFERIRGDYVESVTDEKIIENAVNGMLQGLDPHSAYLSPESFKDMQNETRGEFGGLGIEVTMDGGLVKVVAPIDDTPAFRAGIKSGDLITHIDDQPVFGLTLNDAVKKMRGEPGKPIKIIVRRGGQEPFDLNLVREVIKIRTVKSSVKKDVGIIRISSFNESTATKLREAIDTIKKESGDKLQGIVIDLRNNPGGLLEQAIEVSDVFLAQGEIVSTRGRDNKSINRYSAKSGDAAENIPLVVLINSGSASASEIVAGALQDHKRAVVLGTRSFGKGSVQTLIPLKKSGGAIKMTTSRYYTPSGKSIQTVGIEPDIVVEQAKVEVLADKGFHEGDLLGALDSTRSGGTPNSGSPATTPAPTTGTGPGKSEPQKSDPSKNTDGNKDPANKEKEYDYQLERAIDLIKGLNLYKSGK